MAQGVLWHVLFGMRLTLLERKPSQQCGKRRTAPNSSRKRPRKRLQHSIRACAEASKFHVIALLQEIQDAFVFISFRPDHYEKVVGRAFGRVHSKRSVGRSHIKNV